MKQSAESVRQRREEVRRLLRNKVRPPEIMSYLAISRTTLWRDINALRKEDGEWLEELARDEFVHAYRITIESLEETQRKLIVIAEKAQRDRDKVEALRLLKDIELDILECLAQGPTMIALRRNAEIARRRPAMQGLPESSVSQRDSHPSPSGSLATRGTRWS
jgi:hypothetical protein